MCEYVKAWAVVEGGQQAAEEGSGLAAGAA